MKKRFVSAKIITGLSLCILINESSILAQSRPNVLLIYADDQGSLDLNCYGSTDLVTPNIDRLAEQGVRFSQFYAAPISSPSRASLLTGLFTRNAGLTGNAGGKNELPGNRVTLAEMMKSNGYATALVGKWHLGENPDTLPNAQGFDYFFGHRGGCIDNYSHFFYWSGPNRHDLWENNQEIWRNGQFFPQLTADQVKNYIETNKENPWFVYWAINLPHYPLQGTEKWMEHFKDLPYPRNQYAAFMATLDETVGQVIDYLDKTGQRENTIIIYQSDNGHSVEERNCYGGGNAGPYRGAKFSLFEGGIRIPAIISWPKQLPQNEERDQIAGNVDWFPTIAELCGINLSPYPVDGKSLVPLIRDKTVASPHAEYHWDINNQWAIRKGDWKLYFNPNDPVKNTKFGEQDKYYLTNLKKDISESKNLAREYPEILEELKSARKTFEEESKKRTY